MPVASPRRLVLASLVTAVLSLAGFSAMPALGSVGSHESCTLNGPDTDGDGLTDTFETEAHLDPCAVDSNGDGLEDPAEDPDNDGLSNLAEQTFGTKPHLQDTDGDGKPDGADDANHDGIADWIEQDARPVPNNLTPSIANANKDGVCYQEGVGSTGKCTGDPDGTINIAIYGDSHAGQWIPALDKYAVTHGWHLRDVAKSGCPSIHISTTNNAAFNAECRKWRSDSEAKLRKSPPDLVIVANSTHYPAPRDVWRAGLKDLLSSLPASRVLLLDDTPFFPHRVPSCLNAHLTNMGKCEVARSRAYRPKYRTVAIQVAKETGVAFGSMNPWVCPYALCPVIVNHLLMWRDNNHLTVTYSKQLAPMFGRLVATTLQRRS